MTTDHDEIYEGRVARDEKNYPAMTHDELLEAIDFLPLDGLHAWFQPALRAVVKLHKPDVFNHCGVCNSYLCETIQAIEKELG